MYVPKCSYNDQANENGVKVGEYDDRYCDPGAFQPTFNEYGMCFTFNNRKQGLEEYFRTHDSNNGIHNNGTRQSSSVANKNQNTSDQLTKEEGSNEIFKVTFLHN